MAELGYNERQIVQPGAGALLNTIHGCPRRPQLVMHDDETPLIYLRGAACNPCATANYEIIWSANIAVPTDTTVGEIQLALALDGQILPLTISTATPAAVEQFWHVGGSKTVHINFGCCPSVAVVNASVSPTPATTPAPAVAIRNLKVDVVRVA